MLKSLIKELIKKDFFSKRDYIKDQNYLSILQDKYCFRLNNLGFKLERGEKGTKIKNLSLGQLKGITRQYERLANKSIKNIMTDEIKYFFSDKRKICMVKTDNEKIEFYGKLSDIEADLSKVPFVRTHQSYLVNCKYIKNTSYNHVELMDGAVLPVSQSKRKNIYNIFGKYRKITEK